MKKTSIILLGAALAVVLLFPEAQAWRSVRTGQKNFERAWSAFVFKRPERADEYFAKAADAFSQALAENPPSRTTMFASNLTQAGMSMYFAGRYDQAIAAMDKAIFKDDTVWEPYLFTALSHARKEGAKEAVVFLKRYIKSNPGQPILSGEAQKQIEGLEKGAVSPDAAATALEHAFLVQIINNINFAGRNPADANGMCDQPFWWRNNRSPCFKNSLIN